MGSQAQATAAQYAAAGHEHFCNLVPAAGQLLHIQNALPDIHRHPMFIMQSLYGTFQPYTLQPTNPDHASGFGGVHIQQGRTISLSVTWLAIDALPVRVVAATAATAAAAAVAQAATCRGCRTWTGLAQVA
jgi:hypothetical protein